MICWRGWDGCFPRSICVSLPWHRCTTSRRFVLSSNALVPPIAPLEEDIRAEYLVDRAREKVRLELGRMRNTTPRWQTNWPPVRHVARLLSDWDGKGKEGRDSLTTIVHLLMSSFSRAWFTIIIQLMREKVLIFLPSGGNFGCLKLRVTWWYDQGMKAQVSLGRVFLQRANYGCRCLRSSLEIICVGINSRFSLLFIFRNYF